MQRLSLSLLLALAPAGLAQTFSVTLPEDGLPSAVAELPSGDLVLLSANGGSNRITLLDAAGSPKHRWESVPLVRGLDVDAAGRLAVFGGAQDTPVVHLLDPGAGAVWSTRALDWDASDTDVANFQSGSFCASGGVIAVGVEASGGFVLYTTPVVRFAADGTVAWSRALPDAGFNDVVELADGTFLVTTGTSGYSTWSTLTRLTAGGGALWTKVSPDGVVVDLALTTSGTVVLVTLDGRIVEATDDGTVLRARRLVPVEDELWTLNVAPAPGGGFAVAGNTTGALSGDDDAYVWRFDAQGELAWQRRLGDGGEQWARALCVCANGDVVLAGRSDGKVWFVRLDALGAPGGCATFPTWTSLEPVAWDWNEFVEPPDVLPGAHESAPPVADASLPQVTGLCPTDVLGTRVCTPAVANSSGAPAELWAAGSAAVTDNDLTLSATHLPVNQFGYFLTGQGFGTVVPPGSQGVFCLAGGQAYRFAKPVLATGALGAFGREIDLTAIPGHGAVLPGQTWYFQAWFRDKNPLPTSNFTDAVAVASS